MRARAWLALALLSVALLVPRTARATEENPLGFALGFGIAGAMALGGLPLLVGAEEGGHLSLGAALGVGGRFDSIAFGAEIDGSFGGGSPLGMTSRVRADFLVDPDDEASRIFPLGAIRWDVLGTGFIAGSHESPLALVGVVGPTFWPSTVDPEENGETELYGALGVTAGLRFLVRSAYVRASLEVDYAPMFLESPTFHLHNLDVDARLGITPWARDSPVVLELALRREIGLGEGPRYDGAVLTLGARFDLDRISPPETTPEVTPSEPW